MSEFKIIETQEQFDARIADRLERDRKTYQSALKEKGWKSPEEFAAEVKALNDQIEALNNAAAETQKTLAAKDEEIAAGTKYRTDLAKTRIVVAAGLDIDFADRLKGESEDEWKADAASLAKRVGYLRDKAPIGNPEAGTGSGSTRDQFKNWAEQALST